MSEGAAITGLGAITPVGGDVASTWAGLLAAASGTVVLDTDWSADLPARLAAPTAVDPVDKLDRVEARRLDRVQQLALVAAREAWADAGAPDVAPERLAVVIGTGIGGVGTLLQAQTTLQTKGARLVSPLSVPMLMANGPAATVGLELGARAGVHTPVSACASGAEALCLALDILRLGRADVVVVGGAEAAINAVTIAGFASMKALSTRHDEPGAASRPFDKARDGFVLGEGAGVLVLETAEHARARGARVYAELIGGGMAADAHHIAAPDPTGAGAARAVRLALKDANITPADIGHINPHATSTPAGDIAEATALRAVFGDDLDSIPVSATKGSTGHLLGAAGAVEAIAAVLAVHHRSAPPTRNLDDQDDSISLDVVRLQPRALPAGTIALSTAFGFGGHDVAIIIKASE